VFHPTLTTIIVPFLVLPFANYRIYSRLRAHRVRTVIARYISGFVRIS
jgi:hypothetical protein